MYYIKIDDIRSDLRIPNRITDIIKKKDLKWFGYLIGKDNAIYVNYSYKNN